MPNENNNEPKKEESSILFQTIESVEKVVDNILLMEDRGIVRVMCAVVVANKLSLDPVWLFVVGPPSGGKTEMVTAVEGLDFVHPIDTMTVNTFASGQKRAGKETSLLLRINDGIITYKDFTAILDMNKDARKEIMGQLRCIYDGKFNKETGTGDTIKWKGKLGMIAAVTSIIHQRADEFKSMGERFVQYAIKQPDRKEMARRIYKNAHGMDKKRKLIQDAFTSYINYILSNIEDIDIELSDDTKEELLEIADYSTRARSGLEKDERNPMKIKFVPDPEMPSRVMGQLFTLASAFIAMERTRPEHIKAPASLKVSKLKDDDKQLIFKIALDSIPRKRRQAMQMLAKYKQGVSTAGLAILLKYHTDIMKETLFELNALGLCTRKRDGAKDMWYIVEEYRNTILKFEDITAVDDKLEAEDDVEDYSESNSDVSALFNDNF